MIVYLDIGATLVEGPDRGPAGRLRDGLGIGREAGQKLAAAVMREPWMHPQSLASWLIEHAGVPADLAHAAAGEIWRKQQSEARPIAGAKAVIRHLLDAGHRVGLLSNIWHPYLESVQLHFGALFDEMLPAAPQLFSYREGVAKPDVVLYQRAIARAGCAAKDCLMVGDTFAADIAPAAAAGMRTIWVLHRPAEECADIAAVLNGKAPRPSSTVTSIAQITPALVRQLAESDRPQERLGPPRRNDAHQ